MSEEGADEDEQEEDTQGIPDPEEYRPFQVGSGNWGLEAGRLDKTVSCILVLI